MAHAGGGGDPEVRLTDQDKKDIQRGQPGRVLLRWRGRVHTGEIAKAVKDYKFAVKKARKEGG